MWSIASLTIQHQGMKSALRLQKSMTTCPIPTAFLWKAAKMPLLKLSMTFFNSQLCFHLKRQAKTNYSSLRSTMGIGTLPTSQLLGNNVSLFPLPLKIQPVFKDRLAFCSRLHNSQMSTCRLAASSRTPALLFCVRLSPFTAVNGLVLPQKVSGKVQQLEVQPFSTENEPLFLTISLPFLQLQLTIKKSQSAVFESF